MMSSNFFSKIDTYLPRVQIRLLRAESLQEIPLDSLDQTVFASDFDFTIKYPRFIAQEKMFTRQGACLRGGHQTLEIMQKIKANAWDYYVVSAASPGRISAQAIVSEMKNIYTPEKTDISLLFTDPSNLQSETPVCKNLVNQNSQYETFSRCYIHDNIVLNDYDKAAGTIIKIKSMRNKTRKISQIIFVDDFILNALYYPNDFLNYLANIKDQIADTLTITTVWLDPTPELAMNPALENILKHSYENSFNEAFAKYITYFSSDISRFTSADAYKSMLTESTGVLTLN